MPDQTASEPSMDEILASIRRIISEEAPIDENSGTAMSRHEYPEAAVVHEPEAWADPEPQPEPVVHFRPSQEPEAVSPPMSETNAVHDTSDDEPLVGADAATAAGSAFDDLAATADEAARALHTPPPRPPGRSVDDIAADLLRPLLKEWLDANLADIVRARVDEEVSRIARSRVR